MPGGPKLAVLSYGLWRNEFGGDPKIVGRTIELGDEAYQVLGRGGSEVQSQIRRWIFTFPWRPIRTAPTSRTISRRRRG